MRSSERVKLGCRLAAWALALAAFAPGAARADLVTLRWTAPGDDGDEGTAAAYDLRYAETSFTPDSAWWSAATPATGLPAPAPAGTRESFSVTGLVTGRTYYFVIRTMDDAANVSGFSNVSARQPGAALLDPPTSFAASWTRGGVLLAWSAPPSNAGVGFRLYRAEATGGVDSLLATAVPSQTSYLDTTVRAGVAYDYRIVTYEGANESVPATLTFAVPSAPSLAESEPLRGYPNPAQGHVTFRFVGGTADGRDARVRLTIFDLTGRKICELFDGIVPAEEHMVEWPCASDSGHPVAPGLYQAILESPRGRTTQSIAIVP